MDGQGKNKGFCVDTINWKRTHTISKMACVLVLTLFLGVWDFLVSDYYPGEIQNMIQPLNVILREGWHFIEKWGQIRMFFWFEKKRITWYFQGITDFYQCWNRCSYDPAFQIGNVLKRYTYRFGQPFLCVTGIWSGLAYSLSKCHIYRLLCRFRFGWTFFHCVCTVSSFQLLLKTIIGQPNYKKILY